MAALRRSLLLIPLLVLVHLDSSAAGQPRDLAELLMDADEEQFLATFPKFQEQAEAGLPLLIAEIERRMPPDANDAAREKLAKRQANAAVALLRLDRSTEKAWPLLTHSPDPTVRSFLIHRLIPLGVEASAIVKRLTGEPDLTIRRALLLSLGEFGEKELSPEDFKEFLPKLREIYRSDADPGLHAASEWLLRTWKEDEWLKEVNDAWANDKAQREQRLLAIQKRLAKDQDKTPQWYVNGQRQSLVVIPGPVEFRMGAPATAPDGRKSGPQHTRRIGRTFAVAAKLVTVEQYRQFDNDYVLPAEIGPTRRAAYTGSADMPVVGTTWYQAAAYCNWLSQEEGIAEDQWCYEIPGEHTKLKLNYLTLTGSRLPTEAEMEYSTRAGALTSRYYGESETLLAKYAWYHENSLIGRKTGGGPKAVGTLKPNDLGFFDMHGYLFAWCQESFRSYATVNDGGVVEDREDALVQEGELAVSPDIRRAIRGTPFGSPATLVRSTARNSGLPAKALQYHGFRVARTVAR